MKQAWMLLLGFLATPALAGDDHLGQQAFAKSCARCHVARPASTGAGEPDRTINLALWTEKGTGPEFRAWVKAPWDVRPETACDPRGLDRSEVEDLLAYLRVANTVQQPAAARRKQALESDQKQQQKRRPASRSK